MSFCFYSRHIRGVELNGRAGKQLSIRIDFKEQCSSLACAQHLSSFRFPFVFQLQDGLESYAYGRRGEDSYKIGSTLPCLDPQVTLVLENPRYPRYFKRHLKLRAYEFAPFGVSKCCLFDNLNIDKLEHCALVPRNCVPSRIGITGTYTKTTSRKKNIGCSEDF